MSGPVREAAAPVHHKGLARHLLSVAKGFSLCGGALFIAMVGLSVVSIVGRKLWSAPINGDLELLQMGTGIAAAAFFPYCTMMGEHLRVEFFTSGFSVRANSLLDGFANLLLGCAMGILAWRSGVQAHEVFEAGEVTVMRNIPVWMPIACLIPSLAMTAVCACERALHHFVAKEARQ